MATSGRWTTHPQFSTAVSFKAWKQVPPVGGRDGVAAIFVFFFRSFLFHPLRFLIFPSFCFLLPFPLALSLFYFCFFFPYCSRYCNPIFLMISRPVHFRQWFSRPEKWNRINRTIRNIRLEGRAIWNRWHAWTVLTRRPVLCVYELLGRHSYRIAGHREIETFSPFDAPFFLLFSCRWLLSVQSSKQIGSMDWLFKWISRWNLFPAVAAAAAVERYSEQDLSSPIHTQNQSAINLIIVQHYLCIVISFRNVMNT